jgi:hypothetical protein
MSLQQSPRPRSWLWLAGAALSVGYYFFGTIQRPQRTATGVEHRLFGLGDLTVKLLESPSSRRWLAVPGDPDSSVWHSASRTQRRLASLSRLIAWLVTGSTPRDLALCPCPGTWQLAGSSLRRVWDWPASGWYDEDHLWTSSENGWPPAAWTFDLRQRRLMEKKWADVESLADQAIIQWRRHDPNATEDADAAADRALGSTLSSPLEALPPDFAGGWDFVHTMNRGTGIYLVYTWGRQHRPSALYAVSEELVPRIMRLARHAGPLALSRDGRTLFFERSQSLWRLDLRNPLPALLAEVPVPQLPDPLKVWLGHGGHRQTRTERAPGSAAGERREESHHAQVQ